MTNIKFVVRVSHGSAAPAYVQHVDPAPIHMTTNRKLALLMGQKTLSDPSKTPGASRN
jgi:hypothetical protein